MPIDAAVIQNLGWRQGSVFTLAASTPIIQAHRDRIAVHDFNIPDDARLILVSHDCDVVHNGPHEPRIEVCPAVRVVGGLDGSYTGTRNPRRLQIEIEIGGEKCGYELRAPTRFFLSRETLQDFSPDPDARLTAMHHGYFRHWLAKRVHRTALPTKFDERVPTKMRSKIRKILQPLAGSIHSLLIAIDPSDQELGAGQDYAVQIVALMESEDFADPQRYGAVESAMNALESLLDNCDGIELDACVCQSVAEITFDVFRAFSVWDFDDLSFEAGALVPAQAP